MWAKNRLTAPRTQVSLGGQLRFLQSLIMLLTIIPPQMPRYKPIGIDAHHNEWNHEGETY